MHKHDEAQLNQWYDDLTARLAKTHHASHSPYVARTMQTILAIGTILDRHAPVIDWAALFSRKKK